MAVLFQGTRLPTKAGKKVRAEALSPEVFQVGQRIVEGDEDEQGCHPTRH